MTALILFLKAQTFSINKINLLQTLFCTLSLTRKKKREQAA